jgi:hypothetical protein
MARKWVLRIFALLSVLALGLLTGVGSASATTTGAYTPTVACTDASNSGMGVQAHYLTTNDTNQIRIDGGAGYVGSNRYVRKIEFDEFYNNHLVGTRIITYSGTAHWTAAITGTPTTYLPWEPRGGIFGVTVRIWGQRVGSSTEDICSQAFSLNGI